MKIFHVALFTTSDDLSISRYVIFFIHGFMKGNPTKMCFHKFLDVQSMEMAVAGSAIIGDGRVVGWLHSVMLGGEGRLGMLVNVLYHDGGFTVCIQSH